MSDMPDTTERRAVRSWFEMFCDLSEKYQALVAQQDEYRVPKSVFQAVRDDRNRLADELQALKPGATSGFTIGDYQSRVVEQDRDLIRLRETEDRQRKRIEELSSLVDAQERRFECDTKEFEKLLLTSADWQKRAAVWHRHLKTVIGIAWRQIPPLPDDGADEIVNALKAAQNVLDNGPEADPHWGTDGPEATKRSGPYALCKCGHAFDQHGQSGQDCLCGCQTFVNDEADVE